MRRAVALALLLAGCGRQPSATPESAGARLEAAATRAGLVADGRGGTLTGSWSLDTDRACVVPSAERGESRLGLVVDYGDGQGCAASGTVKRDGETLDVRLGACRLTAHYDGERIVFPPVEPGECQSLCTGRATLDSFTVERVSQSPSEAATLRRPGGGPLCAG